MLRIAGPDEVVQEPAMDLCRVLHPSYGLPRRLVLVALGEPAATGLRPPAGSADGDEHLAEITRIDAVPRFIADRPPRRRAGRR